MLNVWTLNQMRGLLFLSFEGGDYARLLFYMAALKNVGKFSSVYLGMWRCLSVRNFIRKESSRIFVINTYIFEFFNLGTLVITPVYIRIVECDYFIFRKHWRIDLGTDSFKSCAIKLLVSKNNVECVNSM